MEKINRQFQNIITFKANIIETQQTHASVTNC